LLTAFLMMMVPTIAHATHGGTDLCEVLGWDTRDQKVYVLRYNGSEGGPFWTLACFDLRTERPCRQIIVSTFEDEERESVVKQSLAPLRKRLKPLSLLMEPTMLRSRVVHADSLVREYYGTIPRFRVELTGLQTATSITTLRLTTYVTPAAFMPRLYAIPGRKELFAIVAFTGVWWETGYETQVPVLLQSSCGDTQEIEWKGHGE